MIRAIVAMDDKRGIAIADRAPYGIPWNIPEDKTYFRDKTVGSTIIMGRSTYENFDKPLPDRKNIVVSRSLSEVQPGFELVHDLEIFLQTTNDDIWIIGGAKLYEAALPYCKELYITSVSGDFECDRFFPVYDSFDEISSTPHMSSDGYTFAYTILKNR